MLVTFTALYVSSGVAFIFCQSVTNLNQKLQTPQSKLNTQGKPTMKLVSPVNISFRTFSTQIAARSLQGAFPQFLPPTHSAGKCKHVSEQQAQGTATSHQGEQMVDIFTFRLCLTFFSRLSAAVSNNILGDWR